MDAIETLKHNGNTIIILPDIDPQSPRDWCNLGTMACWHNRYNLGDEHSYADAAAMFESIIGVEETARLEARHERDYATIEHLEVRAYWDAELALTEAHHERLSAAADKVAIVLPLYLYDHGGITMSTGPFSCPWDSGQVGFIYVTLEDVRREYGWKNITAKRRTQIVETLKSEVETYATYLEGGVCGFVVLEGTDENDDWCEHCAEHLDSCCGFYSVEDAIENAKACM